MGNKSKLKLTGLSLKKFLYLKEKVTVGNAHQIQVMSGSMWPLLETGEVAKIEPVESPQTGDLIVFWSGKILIVHRVKALQQNLTSGQLELITAPAGEKYGEDLPVPQQHILGRVVGLRYSKMTYISFYVRRRLRAYLGLGK